MPRVRDWGEGTIRQRADGRWEGRLSLGGGRKRYVYGTSRRDVQVKLAEKRREKERGILSGKRTVTGPFLDRWLEDVVQAKVRPRTFQSYAEIVRLHLRPEFGGIPLEKLAPEEVQRFLNAKARRLSPERVAGIRAVLRVALNQALRWGLVNRNVAEMADPPRSRPSHHRVLTLDESRQLLEAVQDDPYEALYVLALTQGLRLGEILALCWEDVDFKNRTLAVRHSVEPVKGGWIIGETKTRGSNATLPLLEVTAASLQRRRQLGSRKTVAMRGLIFPSSNGGVMWESSVVHRFKRVLKAAGLPAIRFHDLRHSCATLLTALGVSPRVVMEVLRHSRIDVTMNTYTQVMDDSLRQAAAVLDRALTTK